MPPSGGNSLSFAIYGTDVTGSKALMGFGKMVNKTAKDVDKAGKGLSKSGMASGKGFGDGLLDGVKGIITVAAVGALFKPIIMGASDLNETLSASNAIFGPMAKDMEVWGKSAARSMGLSQQAAQENANSLGLLFTQVGFNSGAAAGMSKKWVQLAVDLGSFANADPTEILGAMQAATRGEFDELQRFVPMISAAAVEQKALAITGKATTAELTAQDKVLAVQALAFEQTGKAQGDFAKTSDGVANASKTLRAQLTDLAASFGSTLQPATAGFLSFANNELIPTVGEIDDVFRDLPKGIQIGLGGLAGVGAAAAVGVPAFNTVKEKVGEVIERFNALSRVGKGFSLSLGAVGVALTVAAGLVTFFAHRQADAKAAVEDHTGALDAQTGAFTRNNREVALSHFRKNDALKGAKELGITTADLTTAVDRSSEAYGRVTTILNSYIQRVEAQVAAGQAVSQADLERARTAQVVLDALNKETGAVDKAKKAADDNRAAAQGSAGATGELATAHQTAAEKAKAQERALEKLIEDLDTLIGKAVDASEAEISYQAAVDAATGSVKENGKTLDVNTEKGRNNQKALNEIASATLSLIQTKGEQGASEKTLQGLQDRGIVQMSKTARAMGMTGAQADALTKKYFGIPASRLTKLQADKRDADRKIRETKKALEDPKLTKTRRAKLEAENRQALAVKRATQREIDRLHGKTVTLRINRYTYVQTFGDFGGGGSGASDRQSGSAGSGRRALGGPVSRGRYVVGENGPEILDVFHPGYVHNNTKSKAMVRDSARATTAAPVTVPEVHNHYHFPSYVGDKNDLVRALDDLARRGRMPKQGR